MSAASEKTTPTLAVYGDYVCPFSWLVQDVASRAAAGFGIDLEYLGFELRPLPAPFPDERYVRRLWEQGVVPIARELGIEAPFPTVRTRTRKAHEATAFAADHGCEARLRAAIFDAYFRYGRDIGRYEVLVELGADAGLDATDLRNALDDDRYAGVVAESRAAAVALGVAASPGFLLRAGDRTAVRVGWCAEPALRSWIEETLNMVRA